jgi:hypothetical protein
VDIRIGIANSPREISFESAQTAAEVKDLVTQALESESKVITLTDEKGRLFVVPTSSLNYVEIGAEESRRIGFVA